MPTASDLRRRRSLLLCVYLVALLLALGLSSRKLPAQQAVPQATANLTAAWQPLGPSSVVSPSFNNITGRVAAIATDPNDATGNTVYLGTTGGGVWKSTNAAGPLSTVTFAPLTDTLPVFSNNAGSGIIPSLTIGAVAVQPAVNPVLLAGTGDPNNATDSYYGEGLLRSTDGGLTWTLIQQSEDGVNGFHSFIGLATAGFAFSTATPTLVVAAFSTSAQGAVVGATTIDSFPGLYYSTDAGKTWQMAILKDGTTIVQTPQPLGTGETGNAVTSVVWDPVRGMFFAAVRAHGYYSSPDGATWTRLTTQPGTNLTTAKCPVGNNGAGNTNTCPIYRGALAVQPVTGDLYALTVDANNLDQGLWQDLCSATSGTCAKPAPTFAYRIDNGALEAGSGNTAIAQGSYDLALTAAPTAANGTNLYVGTVDLYACSMSAGSSSCTLRDTTNVLDGCNAPAQVAAAQHAIVTVTLPSGVPVLY
ncbi:MAG: sialidase family protein, partial [Acidobacteriaceae bacterium]